jgi:hypothetical protein
MLTFVENPQNDGPHVLTTAADTSGNIHSTDFVVSPQDSGITFTLTATGGSSGQSATTTFTDSCSGSGTGEVTVSGINGSCVAGTPPQGNGPFDWEVVQGGSYHMTISGVTECTGNAITVFIQSTPTGNFCFNATLTGTGTYAGMFTMPNPACFTYPVSYKCGADQACSNADTFNARGPNGECSVHLRASTFDSGCNKTGNDDDCTGTPQGCTITCPADKQVECGSSTDPSFTGTPTVTGGCTASHSDSFAPGCGNTGVITRTWSVTDAQGLTTSCTQTITIVDTTLPTITTCPTGNDLGCNPTTLPTCDSVKAQVVAGDTCSSVTLNCQQGDSDSGCTHTRTFTITAKDACGNVSSPCTVTYTWTVDTTPPTITTCPTGSDLGCNPTTLPTCDSVKAQVVASDTCSSVTLSCRQGDSDSGCTHTRTFTITAKDACGNVSSPCTVTYTWTVDTTPPTITTCPTGGFLGCNPTTLPTCDSVKAQVVASDTCSSVTLNCQQGDSDSGCTHTRTFTITAKDACGNVSSPCTVTYTWTVDTTPPVVSCPNSFSVQLKPGDTCPPSVRFTVTATDNCTGTPTISCIASGATTGPVTSGSTFNVGVTTVTCTAQDTCGNVSTPCAFAITVYTSICGTKFYDANVSGTRDQGEVGIAGWKLVLSGAASATVFTDSKGNYCFTGLLPGSYTVTEVLPNSKWMNTTGGTSVAINGLTCPQGVSFGNVCLGPGGGLTLGFWSNKNGQAILAAHDPAWRTLLNGLNLRNADGSPFTVPGGNFNTAYSAFRGWLLGANATNMAYMLSAQLAAMELNVNYGGVNGNSLVFAGTTCSEPGLSPSGFIKVNDLMADAVAELLADGVTLSGNPDRTCQEFKKNALDNANNNLNFVQSSPCPFTTPY